jgi:beta-glucosidase
MVAPLTAITEKVTAVGGEVLYNNGADPAAAAAVAAQADVAIVFGYTKMGEDNDLPNYHLSINGDALITAVAAAADETVVVLNTGSGVEMPWLADVDAVFNAWYSGEKGAVALANLLWGDANPSGKLPISIPKTLTDSPTGASAERAPGIFADGSTTRPAGSDEIRQINYTERLQTGYKWYDAQGIDPQFEFGFGLSYTTFEYTDLLVEHSDDSVTGDVRSTVSFTVKNTGQFAGAEIPQVYLTLPSVADEPGKRLVGFDRVELAAGESTRVEIVVDSTASNQPFSIWDVDSDEWVVLDGQYSYSIGASSRDLRLTQDVVVDRVAPTISSITVDRTQKLVVVPADELSGVAKVEYSTQKNKQDASAWTLYTGPLQIDAKSTVTFRVTDNAGNVSEVTEVNRADIR